MQLELGQPYPFDVTSRQNCFAVNQEPPSLPGGKKPPMKIDHLQIWIRQGSHKNHIPCMVQAQARAWPGPGSQREFEGEALHELQVLALRPSKLGECVDLPHHDYMILYYVILLRII